GTSLRVLSTTERTQKQEEEVERDLLAIEPPSKRRIAEDLAAAHGINPEAQIIPQRMPSARFWIITALLTLVTFASGIWFMLHEDSTFDWDKANVSTVSNALWETASAASKNPQLGTSQNRQGVHVLLGITLFVLPLILAAAVRWAAHHKLIV